MNDYSDVCCADDSIAFVSISNSCVFLILGEWTGLNDVDEIMVLSCSIGTEVYTA